MSLFGECMSAVGAKPDQYHGACLREYVDQYGIEHRCGCIQHELDDAANGSPNLGVASETVSGEGHPRSNGDGPLTRTTRSDRAGS